MSLLLLQNQHFRNLLDIYLEPCNEFNLLYGQNGSGKTSLLETLYFLSLGRSFRTVHPARLITYQANSFLIHAKIKSDTPIPHTLGIEKHRNGAVKIKLNGESPENRIELARHLPVLLLNPDTYRLLDTGPKFRRHYLDWGVFHVEPLFFSQWQRYQRALKQRNSALQQKLPKNHINIWEEELINTGNEITVYRQTYFEQLKPIVENYLSCFLEKSNIQMNFLPGWPVDMSLENSLMESFGKDWSAGFTQIGPHRADIEFSVENTPAASALSRGEQKLLVCALLLAQADLLHKKTTQKAIYLIDDLAAELDPQKRERVIHTLAELKVQVFVTAVEKNALSFPKTCSTKMFHVEQGKII